jgi:steroid delta-isomerase-like uncharacterized protein
MRWTSGSSDTSRNRDALARHADAKTRDDVDAILQTCADDFFYESVALGQRVEGREELRRFYEALFSSLPGYYGEFDGTSIGDDTAVVWGRWGGTLSGNFIGAAVEPGRKLDIPVTFVCTFRDGLITSDRRLLRHRHAHQAARHGRPHRRIRHQFGQFWSDPAGDLVPELVRPAFISWRARATVGAAPMEWTGTDRVVVRDGRAVVVEVSYDTAPIVHALTAPSVAGAP